jgi:hypothetical protein
MPQDTVAVMSRCGHATAPNDSGVPLFAGQKGARDFGVIRVIEDHHATSDSYNACYTGDLHLLIRTEMQRRSPVYQAIGVDCRP